MKAARTLLRGDGSARTAPVGRPGSSTCGAAPAGVSAELIASVYTTCPEATAALLPAGMRPALRRGRAVWVVLLARTLPAEGTDGNGSGNGNGNGRRDPQAGAAASWVEYRAAVRRRSAGGRREFFCLRADADGALPPSISAGLRPSPARIRFTRTADAITVAVESGRGRMRDATLSIVPAAAGLPTGSIFDRSEELIEFALGDCGRLLPEPDGGSTPVGRQSPAAEAATPVRPTEAHVQFFEGGLHFRPGAATADGAVYCASARLLTEPNR
jgi:hypothetical protein